MIESMVECGPAVVISTEINIPSQNTNLSSFRRQHIFQSKLKEVSLSTVLLQEERLTPVCVVVPAPV